MGKEDFSQFVRREDLVRALKNLTGFSEVHLLGFAEIKRATTGVEGFLSLVLRVKVSFRQLEEETINTAVFIVKSMPSEGFQLGIVKALNVFPREGLYFDKIVPLLREVSAGKVDIPLPACYCAVYGGSNDALYMEDLTASGYSTPDRSYRPTGLDFEHCSIAMKTYGKLHALTVAGEKLLPPDKKTWIEAFPELKKDPIARFQDTGEQPPFKGMLDQGMEFLLEICKQLGGLPKAAEESGKLKKVLQRTWDIMCKRIEPQDKGPNVLCHGDCWMNNLMFQYEHDADGHKKPIGVKFIDLQVARYSHPCLDIMNFIFIGTRKSLWSNHLDVLISMYYESFVKTLKILNNEPPPFTLVEFRDAFFGEYRVLGYYYEVLFSPVLFLNEDFAPSNAEDLTPEKYEEFVTSGNFSTIRERYKSDPQLRSIFDVLVRDFVDAVFPNGLDSPESSMFRV